LSACEWTRRGWTRSKLA